MQSRPATVPFDAPCSTAHPKSGNWLRVVCEARGWQSPSEVGILCRLRLTEAERLRAISHASTCLPNGGSGRTLAAMLCVLACEALQQRPAGPAWSWEPVRARFGRMLAGIPDGRLRDLVQDGLDVWGRPLRRGADGDRRCLHSLVLEAGIPAALMARREFGEFMRQVQQELDSTGHPAAELARRNHRRLPSAWQGDDTISLAADLLMALQPYRKALRDGPEALQRLHPGWRDTLPVGMSDRAAEELILALLQPKTIVRQQLRVLCRRVLRPQGERWIQSLAAERAGLLDPALCDAAPFSDGSVVRVRFVLAGTELALAEREDAKEWRYQGVQSRLLFSA